MNEESKQPPISPELEARIVALVLGEASDFEREDLERLIQDRPELAAFKADVQRTHGMLQVIGAGDPFATETQQDEDWKLPADKRGHVLDVIAGKASVDETQQVVNLSDKAKRLLEGNTFFGYSKAAAVICAVGSLATVALLAFMVNGTHRNWRDASSMPNEMAASIARDMDKVQSLRGTDGEGIDVGGELAGGTNMKYHRFDDSEGYFDYSEGEVSGEQVVAKNRARNKATIAGFAEKPPELTLPAEMEVADGTVRGTVPDGGTVLNGGLKSRYRLGGQVSDRISNGPADQSIDSYSQGLTVPAFSQRYVEPPSPQQDPFGSSMLFGASPAGQDPFAAGESGQDPFGDAPAAPAPEEPAQVQLTPARPTPARPTKPEPGSGLGGLADAAGMMGGDDEMGMGGDENGDGNIDAYGGGWAYGGSTREFDIAKNDSGQQAGGMGGAGMGGGFSGGGGGGFGGRSAGDGKKNAAIAGEKSSPTIGFDGISGLPSPDLNVRINNNSFGVAPPSDEELFDRGDDMLRRVEQERSRAEGRLKAEVRADIRSAQQMLRSNPVGVSKKLKSMLSNLENAPDIDPQLRQELTEQLRSGIATASGREADFIEDQFSLEQQQAAATAGPRFRVPGADGQVSLDYGTVAGDAIESSFETKNGSSQPGQNKFALDSKDANSDGVANGSAYGRWGSPSKPSNRYYDYAEVPGSSGKPGSAENAAKESLQKLAESNKWFDSGLRIANSRQGNGQQSGGKRDNAQRDGEEPGSQQGQSSQSNRKGKFRTTKTVNGSMIVYEWTPGNPVPKVVADSGLGVTAGPVAKESGFYGESLLGDYESAKDFEKAQRTSNVKAAVPAGLNEKKAQDESFSTFSLHVSDVSFKLAQSALSRGEWPEAAKIRVEEFVNAFDYGDPVPCQSEKVACQLEQTIHPFLQQRNLLRVSMRTAAEGRSGDTPLRLTLLLDNSGSMERIDRQETVRRAFALLAAQLKPIDQVTLISFARQPRLLADKVSGAQSGQLVRLIDQLPSEGGTNIGAALQLAFEKAREQQLENAQNRIILLTDGAVNLGNANPESLSQMITQMRDAGIAFDAAGISAEGLNDEILEALTRKGDGRYYLLDSVESADDGFARQIAGALRPAAKNVKVQVEFNPKRVGRYKLLGFEKHRLKKEDFRNDQVDAAEMAAAEAGVAMYQVETKPDGEGDVGSVSVRFRDLATGQMVEHCWPIPYEANTQRPEQAAPSVRIATAAAMLAAKLRGGPLGGVVDLKTLSNLVAGLPERHRNAKRVQQLQQMIQQARQLTGQ